MCAVALAVRERDGFAAVRGLQAVLARRIALGHVALGDAVVAEHDVVGLELVEHRARDLRKGLDELHVVVEWRYDPEERSIPELQGFGVDRFDGGGARRARRVLGKHGKDDNLVAARSPRPGAPSDRLRSRDCRSAWPRSRRLRGGALTPPW